MPRAARQSLAVVVFAVLALLLGGVAFGAHFDPQISQINADKAAGSLPSSIGNRQSAIANPVPRVHFRETAPALAAPDLREDSHAAADRAAFEDDTADADLARVDGFGVWLAKAVGAGLLLCLGLYAALSAAHPRGTSAWDTEDSARPMSTATQRFIAICRTVGAIPWLEGGVQQTHENLIARLSTDTTPLSAQQREWVDRFNFAANLELLGEVERLKAAVLQLSPGGEKGVVAERSEDATTSPAPRIPNPDTAAS